MKKQKISFFKKLTWRHYGIIIATLLLVALFIFPGRIVLDRNVLMLLAVIVILVLWPTLSSGKIPYIMELKKEKKK